MGPDPEKEKVETLQGRWLEKTGMKWWKIKPAGLHCGRALAAVWHLGALRQTKTLGRPLRQHGVSSERRGLVKGKTLKNGENNAVLSRRSGGWADIQFEMSARLKHQHASVWQGGKESDSWIKS